MSATIAALAPATGPAAPFIAAAAGLVAFFGNLFQGCGQTCIQATNYANQAGSQLDTLMAQYFAQPVRTTSMQQAYLQACQQIFAWLQQMCGNPALGNAGKRCIAERLVQRACPSTLNDSNIGGGQIDFCDYISTFIVPVENDTAVVPDSQAAGTSTGTTEGSTTATTTDLTPLLLIAAIGIAALVIL